MIGFRFKSVNFGTGDHRMSISRSDNRWIGENGKSRVVLRGGKVGEGDNIQSRG